MLAATALRSGGSFESDADAKRKIVEAVKSVASRLGNTPSICRQHYIHPSLIATYLAGDLEAALGPAESWSKGTRSRPRKRRFLRSCGAPSRRLPEAAGAGLRLLLTERIADAGMDCFREKNPARRPRFGEALRHVRHGNPRRRLRSP